MRCKGILLRDRNYVDEGMEDERKVLRGCGGRQIVRARVEWVG